MAEETPDGQEKTEEPSEERREQFRERGEIAHSREMSSVLVLMTSLGFLSLFTLQGLASLISLARTQWEQIDRLHLDHSNILAYGQDVWLSFMKLILPPSLVVAVIAMFATLAQTRFAIAWERLNPQWGRLNPLAGLKRMFSGPALLELVKSLGKMLAVSCVAYLILHGEWQRLPAILNLSIGHAWTYWASISQLLFWSVGGLLLFIACGDYLYNFISLEKKMRMSKQELKEEYKQREVDPQVRSRMRRMQRDIANRKTIKSTQAATVVITNPTHYAVALKYELGMSAPVVLAKGVDFLALRMREVAQGKDIPIVENPPLARSLYKTSNIGEEIPESLYKAVSEVIRYVFRIKGIRVSPS